MHDQGENWMANLRKSAASKQMKSTHEGAPVKKEMKSTHEGAPVKEEAYESIDLPRDMSEVLKKMSASKGESAQEARMQQRAEALVKHHAEKIQRERDAMPREEKKESSTARCWVCDEMDARDSLPVVCGCDDRLAHRQCLEEWVSMLDGSAAASVCVACSQPFH